MNLPFQISICGLHEIDEFKDENITHILSILDPEDDVPDPDWFGGVQTFIPFSDIESEADGFQEFDKCADPTDVQSIIDFGRQCHASAGEADTHLLVHCYAGISRSTAATFIILCDLLDGADETDLLKWVIQIRPQAYPNIRVVQLGDELLEREGSLTRALQPMRDHSDRRIQDLLN
ncbi:MAG: protein-tyrosine phosphatase family protein [Verrucomicrobiota bacterium]